MTTNYILFPMEVGEFWKQLKLIIDRAVQEQPERKAPVTTVAEGFPKLLKVKEVCAMFGISKPTLYAWMSQGKIASFKLGSRRFFKATDIQAVIDKNRL